LPSPSGSDFELAAYAATPPMGTRMQKTRRRARRSTPCECRRPRSIPQPSNGHAVVRFGALAATHRFGRLADLPAGPGRYDGHSEGHLRRAFIDRATGSAHQEVVVAELAPGGRVDEHLHAFEEAFYVLEGELTFETADATERLGPDDFVFVERGAAHALRNDGGATTRWLEVSAPRPGADIEDTVFVTGVPPTLELEAPYRVGHFDPADLPAPSAGIGLAGFGGGNVGGAAAKVIVGPDFGSSQLNLMVVQYEPGGFISVHDHAFEEGFFFLTGTIEAELEG
jgi:quercetin dioxygenase-like cupin family protein